MTLHLLCGRWCQIVCPPSGTFLNFQIVCISVAEPVLLPATKQQTYTKVNLRFIMILYQFELLT